MGQVPVPPPVAAPAESPPAGPGSAPALAPPPAAPPVVQPSAPPPSPAPAAPAKREPTPLDPPPVIPPPSGPTFLQTREQVARRRAGKVELPRDFALRQSPWVDFSLTNFWLNERASNFLNVGVQVGGYFLERMRISARLVAPLEEPQDEYHDYGYFNSGSFGYRNARSRSISALYGASFGLILSNSRTFLFAPGLLVMRADVNAYGTSAALALPFDWTTARHLRVGFELAIGHAFGGSARDGDGNKVDRPGGTAIFLQFYLGYSMGHL